MLMVIFGAGASYDSISDFPAPQHPYGYRPPVTNHLFNSSAEAGGLMGEILESIHHVQPLAQRFKELKHEVNLEQELQKVESEGKYQEGVRRQLLAMRFYLQRLFTECAERWSHHVNGLTNYLALMRHLSEWAFGGDREVALVTFNYDTLLDEACRAVINLDTETLSGYISNPFIKLFKPHGSVNWGRVVRIPGLDHHHGADWLHHASRFIGEGAKSLIPSNDFKIMSATNPNANQGEVCVIPAIAIPLQSQKIFECPVEHKELLCKSLQEVTNLLVIGWRGTEEHFFRNLTANAERIRKAVVVNPSAADGESATRKLKSAGIAEVTHYPVGFSDYLKKDGLRVFLGSI